VLEHASGKLIDCVVMNNSRISPALRRRYAERDSAPVECDTAAIEKMGIEVLMSDLVLKGIMVRHNPAVIARVAVDLAARAGAAKAPLPEKR
jgi:2-phospho-L-lactate transferase/gluconeogenesis factor (CofD/UPF0052 family)